MKMKLIVVALAAALPATALQAQAMLVSTFLAKADALQKKGMMALMSSDYKLLKKEIVTHSQTLRAERQAAEKAKRRPAYCPPAKSGLNSGEILAAFRSIPAAQRPRTDVKDALRALLARKFPCRA